MKIHDPILLDFPMPVTTKRLVIRPAAPGDGPLLYEAIHETLDQLKEWFPWAHGTMTPKEIEKTVRTFYSKFILRDEFHLLAFDGDRFVASCSLHAIDWMVPSCEIGYWCRKTEQKKGYVREMVEGIAHFAQNHLYMRRICIIADEENASSIQVAEGVGFALESKTRGLSEKPLQDELRACRRYVSLRP